MSSLLIELDDYSDWSVHRLGKNTPTESLGKYDELKPQLAKSLSLHLNKQLKFEQKTKHDLSCLKLDLVTNYYEFYLHLDTKEVTYFKDLVCQQQVLKQQRSLSDAKGSKLEEALSEPLLIRTNMSIYYCTGSSTSNESMNGGAGSAKKYLLSRVELKYVLGFARLKTSSSLDMIDFTLHEEDVEEFDKEKCKWISQPFKRGLVFCKNCQ